MSHLFTPLKLGALELENRIIIAPMCQYSAVDGSAQDWHLIHLGNLALSGAGLLIMGRVMDVLAKQSDMPVAIQLSHAGRKGSSQAPWNGGAQILPGEPGGWKAQAPSAVAHAEGEDVPSALDEAGLARVRQDFVRAAQRAVRLGFRGIEVHMAHGYLLHQFLSPLSNLRTDAYGGTPENRMRFPLEVFDAIKAAVPQEMPVWIRVSATDWVEGGWDLESTLALCAEVKDRGCAAFHVSTGGVSPKQKIPVGPGFQVPFATRIKAETGLPTIAVGLITNPEQAETIVQNGEADAIALARGILYDPHWPWHAAAALGAQVSVPKQYWRSAPREFPSLFKNSKIAQR